MEKFHFLRELDYNQFRRNTQSDFPSRINKAGSVNVSDIQFIPSLSDKTLTVKSSTKTDGNDYLTQVKFNAVPFMGDNDDANYGATVLAVDNKEYSFYRLSKNDVLHVNCSCLDFYYRFSRFTYEKKALLGDEPKRFEKHTDRAPQNPRQLPAFCKHLTKLFTELTNKKLFG